MTEAVPLLVLHFLSALVGQVVPRLSLEQFLAEHSMVVKKNIALNFFKDCLNNLKPYIIN